MRAKYCDVLVVPFDVEISQKPPEAPEP